MTQEQKDLLLKDLSTRLPYGVILEQTYKVIVITTNTEEVLTRKIELYSINTLDDMTVSGIHNDGEEEICFFEEVKPYLFPLSSMPEEQIKEFNSITQKCSTYIGKSILLTDFCNKHHIDWRGLIPMGLAIDATGLNIY